VPGGFQPAKKRGRGQVRVVDRVGIIKEWGRKGNRMKVVLLSNLSQMVNGASIELHVFPCSISKHLGILGNVRNFPKSLFQNAPMVVKGMAGIVDVTIKGPTFHSFEPYWSSLKPQVHERKEHRGRRVTEGQNTVSDSPFDKLFRHEKGRAAGGTIVVDIVNRDPCQSGFVDGSLSFGGVTFVVFLFLFLFLFLFFFFGV